jgi:hypothetical protein
MDKNNNKIHMSLMGLLNYQKTHDNQPKTHGLKTHDNQPKTHSLKTHDNQPKSHGLDKK